MANKRDRIPQSQLGAELRSFFDHVTSHDTEGVQAAICMVANTVPNEEHSIHICNFGAGDPDVLAGILIAAIDTVREEVPGFDDAWRKALRLRSLREVLNVVADAVKERDEEVKAAEIEKGMNSPDIERAAKNILTKVMNAPGNETKH